MILDRSLAVGYAGEDPEAQLKRLVGLRGSSPTAVLAALKCFQDGQYVVLADAESPRLWQVHDGDVADRTTLRRAWAGDRQAFSVFQREWNRWPEGQDVEFLASSSIQFPMSFGVVNSVGGFLTQLRRSHNGLHFVPHPVVIAPNQLQLASSSYQGRTLTLQYVVPHGVDPTFTFISNCAGAGETFGASAHLILPARWGLLFPHETPWAPIEIRADSVNDFVAQARTDHGQEIHGAENPYS